MRMENSPKQPKIKDKESCYIYVHRIYLQRINLHLTGTTSIVLAKKERFSRIVCLAKHKPRLSEALG